MKHTRRRVTPLHAAVPGRVRAKVLGLYCNAHLKREIEAALAGRPGIRSVQASEMTGNALVRFEPSQPHGRIVALLEQAVSKASPRCEVMPPWRRASRSAGTAAWHALEAAQLLERFDVRPRAGLKRGAARQRLARYGANLLPLRPPRSSAEIFLGQFGSLPVALLGVSAALSLFTGGLADALVIGAVLLANAAIGYMTESHAERTINELNKMVKQHAAVLRGGRLASLDPAEVVPGDLLLLFPGSAVAADARLIEARHLTVDESALTGESTPVTKSAGRLARADIPLAERINMVYRGTAITGGSGVALVVGTGSNTEIGRIDALLGETRTPHTPMQKQLDRLGNQLVFLSAPLCAAMFALGLLRGYGAAPMLKSSIALFVAAIPEGLPTVATTIMSLGLRDMRRQNVLVRRLHAVEALGAVQVLCLDKTGTLTQNRMKVVSVACATQRAEGVLPGEWCEDLRRLVSVAVLCNDTEIGPDGALRGSSTENALVELGFAAGLDVPKLRSLRPRLRTIYRTEGRPYMATVHRAGQGFLIAVKGNPADVLALCRLRCVEGEARELTDEERESIRAQNEQMAGSGLRVLGAAYRFAAAPDAEAQDLVWIGLAGMADPVRVGARAVVAELHRAGIRTTMITGDQSATAYAVGAELGLSAGQPLEILDASRLDQMDEALLAGIAPNVHVFARVSPAQKLKIVQALQRAGKVVAMTGDGINDGPALKSADVGIAMGRAGTDVARSVADIVLEDDELASLLGAIRHGRATYDNIRKSIHYLLATNMSEIQVMVASVALGLAPPVTPIQLLWINLISDILPALALALEPPEPGVMARRPRDSALPVAAKGDFKRLAWQSAAITCGTLAAYGVGLARHGGGPRAGSVAFMTLTSAQLLHALCARSEHEGMFTGSALRPNPYLRAALGGSFAAQGLVSLTPALRGLLGVSRPALADLAASAAGAALPFIANEAAKALMRQRSTR